MTIADTPDRQQLIQVTPARFVTIELASVLTGLTPGAIRTNIFKGKWIEGREYQRRDGRVFVDMRGYERWVEQGQAPAAGAWPSPGRRSGWTSARRRGSRA